MKKLLFLVLTVLSLSCVGCSTAEVSPDTTAPSEMPSDDASDGVVTDSNGVIGDSDMPSKTN